MCGVDEGTQLLPDCVLGMSLGQTGQLSAFPAPTGALSASRCTSEPVSMACGCGAVFNIGSRSSRRCVGCHSHLVLSELWCERAAVCCLHFLCSRALTAASRRLLLGPCRAFSRMCRLAICLVLLRADGQSLSVEADKASAL